MNNRIGLLLKVKDVTASRFAEMIGVQPSNISHILSGRNKPSLDFITKVTETFPDISLEWIMFGRGSMMGSSQMENSPRLDNTNVIKNHEETSVDSHEPDLFSQIQTAENAINEVHTEPKPEDDRNIQFTEDPKEIISDVLEIENEEKEEIEENENNEKVEIVDDKSQEEQKQQIDNDFNSSERHIIKESASLKPIKIILVYPDDTFEILQERVLKGD